MLKLLTTAIIIMPVLGWAHEMRPNSQTEIAVNNIVSKTYELTNSYPHPSIYEVEVLNKDFSPADNWKAKKYTFKMLPDSTKQIKLKFKATQNRKLLVCTTLKEKGKNNETAYIQSRICSRLTILSSGR